MYVYPIFESFKNVCVLGEHEDRNVIEIEPHDANFLEEKFPSNSEYYEPD